MRAFAPHIYVYYTCIIYIYISRFFAFEAEPSRVHIYMYIYIYASERERGSDDGVSARYARREYTGVIPKEGLIDGIIRAK